MRHLSEHLYNYSFKIILGDINAKQFLTNDHDVNFFNSLYSVPYVATYHRGSANTWLDLCLVDARDSVPNHWKSEVPFINGHTFIAAELGISASKDEPLNSTFTYPDYKYVSAETLSEYLKKCDWAAFTTVDSSLIPN